MVVCWPALDSIQSWHAGDDDVDGWDVDDDDGMLVMMIYI